MRVATSYLVTDVRRPGVSPAGIAFSIVATPVVILRLEEEDHKRLLGLGVVERDNLRGRESLRRLPLAHLAVHLLHPVLADPFEGHNTCERHSSLLCRLRQP